MPCWTAAWAMRCLRKTQCVIWAMGSNRFIPERKCSHRAGDDIAHTRYISTDLVGGKCKGHITDDHIDNCSIFGISKRRNHLDCGHEFIISELWQFPNHQCWSILIDPEAVILD